MGSGYSLMAEPTGDWIASDMEVSHRLMEKLISNYGLKESDFGGTVEVATPERKGSGQ